MCFKHIYYVAATMCSVFSQKERRFFLDPYVSPRFISPGDLGIGLTQLLKTLQEPLIIRGKAHGRNGIGPERLKAEEQLRLCRILCNKETLITIAVESGGASY